MDQNIDIINRESWLKFFIIGSSFVISVVIIILFFYSIFFGKVGINIIDFRFTDLLSFVMALFAIFISILFYFKATETSNQFYDNTYKFTKETSEILGRIEAGFDARLKNIDESYSHIRDRVENLPYSLTAEIKKEITEDERTLEKIQNEKVELIQQVTDKAQLPEQERDEFFNKLGEYENTITQLKTRLEDLQIKYESEPRSQKNISEGKIRKLRGYITYMVLSDFGVLPSEIISLPSEVIEEKFNNIQSFNWKFLDDMWDYGFIDENGKLTELGVLFIRSVASRASR